MLKFLDVFRKNRDLQTESPERALFLKKYQHFQNLLAGNNHALELIAELEQLCHGPEPFTLESVTGKVERLMAQVYDIAEDLNALSGGKFPTLSEAVEGIGADIFEDLARKRNVERTSLTLSLGQISRERLSEVGGKSANLGEILNRVHLPAPAGFAVTAYACHHFMESKGLYRMARETLRDLKIEDTPRLVDCSNEIQRRILEAPLPTELEEALLKEMDALIAQSGPELRIAVRSSATGEDSEASFAGQHSSVLAVDRAGLPDAYKAVVASTYNPRAIYYRRSKGYPDESVIMSVLCVEMVDARASGVMYTKDPNSGSDVVLVNAVWGLGLNAVDGSVATDFYEADKSSGHILSSRIAEKATRLVLDRYGVLKDEAVPLELQREPCLDEARISEMVRYGTTLEKHFGLPQDIEWALDVDGRVVILQSRQLNLGPACVPDAKEEGPEAENGLSGHEVLLRGGITASRGKAGGLAYLLDSDHSLVNIPEGAILIATQTSPRYVSILGHVQAIVTDVGSVTGHMASVAREFGVPALVGTVDATRKISHGEEITVDATNQVIYRGRVESILERKRRANPMKGSPTYRAAHSALKKIAVLNLVDPKRGNFTPEGCRTLHDAIRLAHEFAMREMFYIGEDVELSKHSAIRIKAPLPMNILAVDLGGGLNIPAGKAYAGPEEVLSIPFKSLLKGMTDQAVNWVGPVGMNWKGFASIVSESLLRDPLMDDTMGGPSYVVMSGEYVNFNSRLGYHFAVVDAYCGPHVNDNYVGFSFKGGAADIGRRSRRAGLIALILQRLGFQTTLKGDLVRGVIKKYECPILNDKLEMLGRLMGAVRLLDMVLCDDGQIDWYADEFMKGNYTFERP
ncbi:MAG: PEP/pyruvate-binding domain-containing protein [Syntrophobacteraceae bacterium]|jgi:pyruvate,water dikinase